MALRRANILLWAALAVVAVAAAVASVWLAVQTIGKPDEQPEIHGTYLQGGRPIAEFTLTDHNNEPFTPERLKGKWTLLTFNYTDSLGSADTSAESLEMLSLTYRRLDEAQSTENLQVVFVSLLAQQDQAPRLADVAPMFNRNFISLTGSEQQISKLTQSLGMRLTRTTYSSTNSADRSDTDNTAAGQSPSAEATPNPAPRGPAYSIRPQGTVLLINPDGKLLTLFTPPHHPQLLAEDLYEIIQHERRQNWLAPIISQ